MSAPAGSAARPVRLASAWSCSTAGDRPARARQRRLACRHADIRRAVGHYPHTTLTACGRAVGLPEGQMGNSEVGHLNLGAGASSARISCASTRRSRDGSLAANPVLRAALADARARPTAGARLRRRRALLARASVRADRRSPQSWRPANSSCTLSPTAATRCRSGRRAIWPSCERQRARNRASARSAAATGRWTATSAGSARSAPTTCWCTAARLTAADVEQARARRIRARRDRRIHRADPRRGRGTYRARRQRAVLQLPSRSHA